MSLKNLENPEKKTKNVCSRTFKNVMTLIKNKFNFRTVKSPDKYIKIY